jgi:hypothetical protein
LVTSRWTHQFLVSIKCLVHATLGIRPPAVIVKPATCNSTWPSVSYTTRKSTAVADVHTDAEEYGLNGGNTTNSTFAGKLLGSPALNISAPSLVKVSDNTYSYSDIYVDQTFLVTDNISRLLWGYKNQTYNLDYLQQSGSCQPILVYQSLTKPPFFC